MFPLLVPSPPAVGSDTTITPDSPRPNARFWGLTIGSVGVVYGDIGTSPLYAFRETLRAASTDGTTPQEIIGIVSLLIWALLTIVTCKYVVLLLNADNRGEGGDLALFARVIRATGRRSLPLLALGISGAAFFFGDAILTPAISVLSAIEGFELVVPGIEPIVLPIAAAVLTGLFIVQQRGTGAIAAWFGPIMTLWFLVIGGAGLAQLLRAPQMLAALSPVEGLGFLAEHGQIGLIVLAAVFLAVTGAEALYADLGHFGRRPIRAAWFGLVLPALVLNYLGQGALVILHPEAAANPFFLMVPDALRPALVVLATLATVIAAQAVITGAFSLTRQALQLGMLPRMEIRHTSQEHHGQIYIPTLNWFLMIAVIILINEFQTSSALASAYGISVAGSMVVTTLIGFLYLRHARRWPGYLAALAVTPLLIIELGFFAANLMKLPDGGYVPIMIAAVAMLGMAAWVRGTGKVVASAHKATVDLDGFVRSMAKSSVARVPGTAVFLTSDAGNVPPALLHNLKHNRVLHERNVVLTVVVHDIPRVAEADRCTIVDLDEHFIRLTLAFGFMETPNISRALVTCRKQGLKFDVMTTSFFLGRRRFVPGAKSGLGLLMDRIYVALTRMSGDPIDYFHIPRDRAVEIGARMSV